MQFPITREIIDQLSEAIANGNDGFLMDFLKDLHGADIAEIINELDGDDGKYLFRLLENEQAADTLTELDEDVREELLESLTTREIAAHIEEMDSDDAADVVGELPEEKQREVISQIEDKAQVSDIEALLNYEEGTAGAIMAREFVKANLNWPVDRCIVQLRKQAQEVEHVYTVYVVNDEDQLEGLLSLKSLLVANPKQTIGEVYQSKNIKFIQANQSIEEAARLMERYDLVVLPVVDDQMRLIGRITIDDVVDVIREEAEKDYQMASGLSEKVESSDTVWVISRARLPWLLIAMIGGIFGSMVIGQYEDVIGIHPEMAMFIPLIAAMGGNVGIQSSAIVVQGLAADEIQMQGMAARLFKELIIGMVNGLVCASVILGYSMLTADSLNLGFTVSIALLTVICFAAVFGTFVPLLLNKYKVDPALATGPFITTTNDILGVTIYFLVGHFLYF
ncbi:MAG TPA: magnesium transporter [Flavobacteriales bacterium]|nr:magnesium transporter [Flavobacteriales bacterium]HRE74074.1 magnesium transporter [Flavobacteriales bacterium]HRE97726.1 magnesium transporter [Flavobacteriales bacterium]HRJ35531.1 magnesium transporter [Flavobacteriales bacterium]HRJ40033.1 magnesium transporter [Flavobacteriales bacterium]